MAAAGALTEPDVLALRAEASAGRPVTVWFTAAAVGVPAGGSAKVVSVGEPAEGDFIQVRAAGTRDTMFCSPGELTRTRPSRKRGAAQAGGPASKAPARPSTMSAPARAAAAPAAPGEAPVRAGAAGAETSPAVAARAAGTPAAADPAAAPAARPASRARAAPGAAAAGAAAGDPAAGDPAAAPGPKPARAARPRRRSDPTGELSLSLTATADGEWTVDVRVGTKRIVAALPVPAADVATAARSLPAAVAEAIVASLEGARQRQRERVEQLRAELDAAQQVLEQLGV